MNRASRSLCSIKKPGQIYLLDALCAAHADLARENKSVPILSFFDG